VSIFDRISSGADRLAHAWNAFSKRPSEVIAPDRINYGISTSYGGRPDRTRITAASDRSIISSIYTRLSMDVAAVNISHVYLDQNKQFIREANSGLNNCLTLEANIDQGARAFRQDIAMMLFDKGVAAIVPVDTSDMPLISGSWDILTMRVAEIIQWYPQFVRVRVYNEQTGKKEELTLPKSMVAIVENPLSQVMNEPNSTLQRLIRTLSLTDTVDEAAGSGKLDLIIQLPYVIRNETKKNQADERARDIEMQLKSSKYGIAYTDGTEKVTQLNRPVENTMLAKVQFLTTLLYSQLGLTEAIFNGTADDKTIINYHNRTIEPVLAAIAEAMKRTFLTKTARTQGQSIEYRRDPFKMLAITEIGDLADKLTRNEILSSNEFRSLLGFKPSVDPNADKLLNKNLPIQAQPAGAPPQEMTATPIRPQPTPQLALPASPGDTPVSMLSS
jgi:hypothetical protein